MKQEPIPFVEGQDEVWCQLCPFGEYPVTAVLPDGKSKRVKQLCDAQAFNTLVRNFQPEVLVDAEHRSQENGDTLAMAWVQELAVHPQDGLRARLKLTDVGAADVANRRRRFLSPAWELDGDYRPERLIAVGLTNLPNITMRPVLNKESPAMAAGKQEERSPVVDLKTIAVALGLPETATAEEVLAAAKAAVDKAGTLEARVAELEQAAAKTEAEGVVAANKDRIADPEKFAALYVANKDFALKVLDTMAKPAATVANKADGKRPASAGGTAANKLQQYRALPDGKEKDAFLAANKAELLRLQNEEPNGRN